MTLALSNSLFFKYRFDSINDLQSVQSGFIGAADSYMY